MPDDEPYTRALRDPDFLRRFSAQYAGHLDPLEALRRYAARDAALPVSAGDAQLLYGRVDDAESRSRLAASLASRRSEETKVRDALGALQDHVNPVAGPDTEARSDSTAPASRRTVRLVVVGAVLLACVGIGFAAGFATSAGAPHPTRTPSRPVRELPAAITFDNRDGQQALLAVRSVADPRSLVVNLPPVVGGYDLATACLASSRRPAVLPDETVLLLSSTGRQLTHLVVSCDGDEQRIHVLPPVDVAQTVQIVIDVNTETVRASWVTLNPAGT